MVSHSRLSCHSFYQHHFFQGFYFIFFILLDHPCMVLLRSQYSLVALSSQDLISSYLTCSILCWKLHLQAIGGRG